MTVQHQTLQIVEKYRNKLNLKVSQLETNSGGPGKPRNVALKQAEGEFVLFVDSDDYINKETLKDAAAFIDEHHSDVLLIKMKGVNGQVYHNLCLKKQHLKLLC